MKNTHSLEGNSEVITGDHWESNYGLVKILRECKTKEGFQGFRLRFLNTGGLRVIRTAHIKDKRYSDFQVTKPKVKGMIKESHKDGRFIICSELDRSIPIGHQKVWVKFINTGGVRLAHWPNVHRGDIKDLYKPSYAGVGYLGYGNYDKGSGAGSPGQLWTGIFRRTVEGYCENEKNSSYHSLGTKMCEDWHNFQNFAEWFYSEPNHDKQGWHLDKDMKVFGAKVYSPETCCFIPFELNNFLFFDHYNKGYERRGVFKCGDQWHAQSGQNRERGFGTSKDAFMWYKQQKENEALRLADKWDGIVDSQVIRNLRTLDIQPRFHSKEEVYAKDTK